MEKEILLYSVRKQVFNLEINAIFKCVNYENV